jgi:hypothetical protein
MALMIRVSACSPDSELGTLLSRAIQKSYHVHQQQYLARVRDLVLAHDPHEPPVAVGSPLPLDINFFDRWKKGEVKVRLQTHQNTAVLPSLRTAFSLSWQSSLHSTCLWSAFEVLLSRCKMHQLPLCKSNYQTKNSI